MRGNDLKVISVYCFINVLNSTITKTITSANTWYKADWGTNTAATTCKWTIVNNSVTYQPANKRNGIFSIAGKTTLRINTANQPFQFSFLFF